MISYAEAIQLIQQHTPRAAVESVTVAQACGRVCAETIRSREILPAFDNSAMDGFAVCADDAIAGASLRVIGSSFAGESPASPARVAQSAWRIMTGAPMPAGFDAVVPIEKVQCEADCITLSESVVRGQHIRRRGEDFSLQAPVLSPGQKINALTIMALAATGQSSVAVFRNAQAVVFATGDELVDDAQTPLAPGQIRNSNAPFLLAALASNGVHARYGGLQRDNADAFQQQLATTLASQPDLIVSSGAVSAGDADFIPQVIRALGGDILFHKVAIKPGKPVLLARFANGTHYFGLPGNPISTAIGFRFFVQAFLRARMGLGSGLYHDAVLTSPLNKKTALREFRKAVLRVEQGQLLVSELSGQESHRIAPLQHCNGWLVIDENTTQLQAGQLVQVAGLFDDDLAL